ncbi:acyl-coenzyme A thioesterase 2, chloroplastic-like [Aristolochia californica]|uniref:acyl-coenzyme A thioesterase 2, chloroplastic-like n=1 Tax=Aristolochia californica TaxID=171875 RepID=UPI0035DA78CB
MQQMRSFSSSSMLFSSSIISVFSKFSSSLHGHAASCSLSSFLPGMPHSATASALWNAQPSIFRKLLDPPKEALPQTEFISKTASQSRTNVLYSFSKDYPLREQYRDACDEVKIGNLLEDLDMLAGTVAIKHCSIDDTRTRPPFLVTASVENMVLKKPIDVATDMKIAGAVSWVGRSSLEVQVEVTQLKQGESSETSDPVALTAIFTFAARDSTTGNSAPVNRLTAVTEREKLLLEEGHVRDRARKKKRDAQRRKSENHGTKALHSHQGITSAEGKIFPVNATYLENSFICQPQNRNFYGQIFGGFLMHQAFELAFASAYNFVGQMPRLHQVNHVDFFRPVDVEDFLRFKSWVLFVEAMNPAQPLIHVAVEAHVTRPERKISEMSNRFNFTFTLRDALKKGHHQSVCRSYM